LSCCTNTNTALFFSSIDEIPSKIWDSLQCSNNIYFDPNFLKSIEKNHSEILFSYIVLVDKNNSPTAFASIKIIDFHINAIKNELEFLKNIGRKLRVLPSKKPLKLLICGNSFVSGEHGVFIKKMKIKKPS